jgi:hypothetical protein
LAYQREKTRLESQPELPFGQTGLPAS